MAEPDWKGAIRRWRNLSREERQRRHIAAIPSHVANSMAMEGEPVDEEWIRQRITQRMAQLDVSKPNLAS